MFLKYLLIFFILLNYLQAEEFEKVYNISMAEFDKMIGDVLREMKIKLKNVRYDSDMRNLLIKKIEEKI